MSHLQQKFKTNERHEFCQGLSIEDTWCILKKMRLRVCEREWKEFKEDMSKIPLYLLRYLKIHDDGNMTLLPADLLYRHCSTICSAITAITIIQVVAMV